MLNLALLFQCLFLCFEKKLDRRLFTALIVITAAFGFWSLFFGGEKALLAFRYGHAFLEFLPANPSASTPFLLGSSLLLLSPFFLDERSPALYFCLIAFPLFAGKMEPAVLAMFVLLLLSLKEKCPWYTQAATFGLFITTIGPDLFGGSENFYSLATIGTAGFLLINNFLRNTSSSKTSTLVEVFILSAIMANTASLMANHLIVQKLMVGFLLIFCAFLGHYRNLFVMGRLLTAAITLVLIGAENVAFNLALAGALVVLLATSYRRNGFLEGSNRSMLHFAIPQVGLFSAAFLTLTLVGALDNSLFNLSLILLLSFSNSLRRFANILASQATTKTCVISLMFLFLLIGTFTFAWEAPL